MDRELVEAARRGDQEAYADLVRPRADRLFATAYRILRDVDRAEDALPDALVIGGCSTGRPPFDSGARGYVGSASSPGP